MGFAVNVKAAALTVSAKGVEALVRLMASPPYAAVTLCEATVRFVVLYVATPEEFNVAVPNAVLPSLKVTVPVGVPDPETVTVAVKVTELPAKAGFMLAVTVVDVFSCTV